MNNLTKKDFDKIQKYRISAYTQEPNEVGGYIFHKKFHEKIWIGDIDKIIQLNNLVLWKKNKKEWLMRNPDALYFKNDKHFFCFEYYTEPTQEEIDKMLEGL